MLFPSGRAPVSDEFNGPPRFFRGLLSDVRIYRMALSPAEVQAVMKE